MSVLSKKVHNQKFGSVMDQKAAEEDPAAAAIKLVHNIATPNAKRAMPKPIFAFFELLRRSVE